MSTGTFNLRYNPQTKQVLTMPIIQQQYHMQQPRQTIRNNVRQNDEYDEEDILEQEGQDQGDGSQQGFTQQQFTKRKDNLPLENPQSSSGWELANLLKIYSNDMKYRGGEDSLDMKLQIFYDLCPKAGVPPESYSSAFSIMLKGDARDYYYDKISGRGLTFLAMSKTI